MRRSTPIIVLLVAVATTQHLVNPPNAILVQQVARAQEVAGSSPIAGKEAERPPVEAARPSILPKVIIPVPPVRDAAVPNPESPIAETLFDARFRQIFDEVLLNNGLVLDRRSDRNTVSCAATGFTAYSLALMVERETAGRTAVMRALRRGFRNTLAGNPSRNRGWLSHFTDADGVPKPWSEVSTIDSAIFYFGFLRAAETLKDENFLNEVKSCIAAVDQEMMIRDGFFIHGLYWDGDKPRWLNYQWNDTSEGVMLYRLFDRPFQPKIERVDYPLFVYYYPLCFFNDEQYVRYLGEAVRFQVNHYGYTGVTASDGPQGYQADDHNLISPLTLFALSGLFPEARATLAEYTVDHMVPAYHIGSGWVAPDRVTIDYASAYILMVRPGSQVQFKPWN